MTKQEFVADVARRSQLSNRDAGKAVDAVLETITDTLKGGGDDRHHPRQVDAGEPLHHGGRGLACLETAPEGFPRQLCEQPGDGGGVFRPRRAQHDGPPVLQPVLSTARHDRTIGEPASSGVGANGPNAGRLSSCCASTFSRAA